MISDEVMRLIIEEQARQGNHFIEVTDLPEYLSKMGSKAEIISICSPERCKGFVAFYCNDSASKIAYVPLIAVDPQYRGSGLGKALTAWVLDLSKCRGFSRCQLEVRKENSIAFEMYISMGFKIMEDRGEKYLLEISLEQSTVKSKTFKGGQRQMSKYDNWDVFWDEYFSSRYGKEQVVTEEDLYFQVARTVNRRPIGSEVFHQIVDEIIEDLLLMPEDILIDLCCGNGLFTFELKDNAKQIIGVDFSKKMIDTANKYKRAPNITYCLGNVIEHLDTMRAARPTIIPNKYMMLGSLGYFSSGELIRMLTSIILLSHDFKFVIRDVPNAELKWNFYDTAERKKSYNKLLELGDLTYDGIGNWWSPDDIKNICDGLRLKCSIRNQELPISNYRMDVLIEG
ncbi:MAG: GNAT family N-acetyltransferase [Syntrophobacteraceae bacterium]